MQGCFIGLHYFSLYVPIKWKLNIRSNAHLSHATQVKFTTEVQLDYGFNWQQKTSSGCTYRDLVKTSKGPKLNGD